MTSVFGHRQTAPLVGQSALQRLPIGQKIEVTVLGLTRQGLAVQIGSEKLQLDVPARLGNAGTLVLEGLSSSSVNQQQVRVIASDDQPLARPIIASLRSRSEPISTGPNVIIENRSVKVTAEPLTPDGKVSGASVALRLKTDTLDSTGKVVPERPAIASRSDPTSTSRSDTDVPKEAVRQAGPIVPRQPQPERGGGGSTQMPTERASQRSSAAIPSESAKVEGNLLKGNGPVGTFAPGSAPSKTPPPVLTQGAMDGPHLTRTSTEGGRGIASSTSTNGGGASAITSSVASAASVFRNNADVRTAGSPKSPLEVSSSISSQGGPDRSRPMMATVVGKTDAGKIILKTERQQFRIEQPIDLPTGASLQITLLPGMPGSELSRDQGGLKDIKTHLTKLIEILDDIDKVGRQVMEPDQTRQAKQLPLPDGRLASKFLGLLDTNHDAEMPKGRTTTSSGQIGADLTRRDQVQTLVRELGTMASDSLADGWKSVTLPLGSDQAQAVAFFFREQAADTDDEAEDGDSDISETQRAIFDVSFSQLGRCQIDALCQERRFELMIRSEQLLSKPVLSDVASLFSSACEISGMKGEIGFKVGGFFEPARSSIAGKDLRT